jgi:predicted metal-binding membrane protein
VPLAARFHSFTRAPWPLVFTLAALGLMLSLYPAREEVLPVLCSGSVWLPGSGTLDLLAMALELNSPVRLATDWASMLLAMMPPLLVMPLMYVWRSSLPRRRVRAVACFVFGYGLVWMAVGPILIGLVLFLFLSRAMGDSALAGAVLLAVVWSASPWQRAALNHSHRLTRIGLFGWAADRDSAIFGARHATLCVASCWAWMLVPLTAGRWHILAMIFAGGVMLLQRLAAPDLPRWRLPKGLFLLHPRLVVTRRSS